MAIRAPDGANKWATKGTSHFYWLTPDSPTISIYKIDFGHVLRTLNSCYDNSHFYLTPSTEGVESTRGNSVCQSICPASLFPSPNIVFLFLPCSSSSQLTHYFSSPNILLLFLFLCRPNIFLLFFLHFFLLLQIFSFSKHFPPFPSSWQGSSLTRSICLFLKVHFCCWNLILHDYVGLDRIAIILLNTEKCSQSDIRRLMYTLHLNSSHLQTRGIWNRHSTIHILPAWFLRLTIYCSLMLMVWYYDYIMINMWNSIMQILTPWMNFLMCKEKKTGQPMLKNFM